MQTSRFAILFALASLATACSDSPPGDAVPPMDASSLTEAQPTAPTRPAPRYEISCDGNEWALIGDDEAARVERSPGSELLVLPKPRGMQDYVPVGMGCTRSAAGDEYLVVGYGEAWVGCNICEWFFVYDRDGRPLNHSDPAMLGDMGALYPNNEGYEQVTRQLQLETHEIHYPPRARSSDMEIPTSSDAEGAPSESL